MKEQEKQGCLTSLFSAHNDNNGADNPRIFLAMQGGGSHGAFTAGVIEALHEADILKHITGMSGTSAGAFNAAPLSYALNSGKPELAVPLITKAWKEIAENSTTLSILHNFARASSMIMPHIWRPARYPNLPQEHVDLLDNAGHVGQAFGLMSQPGDIRKRMSGVVPDWNVIKNGHIKTVIGATEVSHEGGQKIFSEKHFNNHEIDADAVAASATLIGTHRKDRKNYVDGGYTSNPPLTPALDGNYTDVLAIMLSEEPEGPITGKTQSEQINGVSFLHDEVYGELALLAHGSNRHTHVIQMTHEDHWNETSKMNSEGKWIADLYNRGLEAGREWVARHKNDLGKRTTYKPQIAPCQECALDKPECAVA